MNLAPGGKWTKLVNTLRRRASWLVAAGVIAFAALALVPVPRVPVLEWGLISAPLVAAGGFVAIALGLARKTNPLFINPFFVRLGQVSFSAYLLHFVFLNLAHKFWERDLAAPTGLWAVLVSGAAFLGVLGVTFAASLVTYRVIEKPAMDLGSSIIRRLARNHK